MKTVRKGGGGVVNIWSLKEKISGMAFVNPNIPALKKKEETWKLKQSIHLQNILKTTPQTASFQKKGWFSIKPCHSLRQVHTG